MDSILIDEARTPLIISGQGEKSTQLYDMAEMFVSRLKKQAVVQVDNKEEEDPAEADADYIVDEKAKTAMLTARGIAKAEEFFHVENLSDPENATLSHHVNQAIKAHGVMKRDIDYVLKDGEVVIVDEFTGRLMFGRRYSNGLHQAIEAKEHVDGGQREQDLGHHHLPELLPPVRQAVRHDRHRHDGAGGVRHHLRLDIVEIPTNRPNQRHDHPTWCTRPRQASTGRSSSRSRTATPRASRCWWVRCPLRRTSTEQPPARRRASRHNLLNAKNHEKEAEIVAQAGKFGAVTVATNMAGRGTDIMLGGNAEYLARADLRRPATPMRSLPTPPATPKQTTRRFWPPGSCLPRRWPSTRR